MRGRPGRHSDIVKHALAFRRAAAFAVLALGALGAAAQAPRQAKLRSAR